jgi:hypothetical protein
MDDEEYTPPRAVRIPLTEQRDIANAGAAYHSIAARLSEVARRLGEIPAHHRGALLFDLGRELRRLGDITHDFARAVEGLSRAQKEEE